jgi:NADPH:quinone reductase-like Zn-dependent oxidoreductase
MKAVTFHQRGGPEVLRYEDFPRPEIGPGEVLVRVRACALNHLDIFTRQGKQGVKAKLPHIGGLETAGVIAEAASDVKNARAGRPVLVAPFVVCGRCEFCRAELENLCENRAIIGVQAHGGFAEYVKAPARNVIPIPEGLSFEEAAATPSAFGTAWHMLVGRAKLQRGEWLLVLAAGSGIGTAAIQIAKHFDCPVIATASTREKLDRAVALGADHVVNYAEERFDLAVQRITGDRGVDVVFEHVGEDTWKESVASLRPGGRLVTCGGTTGRWGQTDIWSLFGKQLSLLGSFGAVQSDFETVLDLVGRGVFQPVISRVYPLAETARAQAEIEDRKHFGKVIVVPEN